MTNESHSDNLHGILHHVGHLLPAQGPIGVFVHHNTLHAFQHKPFEEAVVEASKVYGSQPYLTEAAYRAEMKRGRILLEDIDAILNREENAAILGSNLDRRTLRRMVLLSGRGSSDPNTLAWQLEEDQGMRADGTALYQACLRHVPLASTEAYTHPQRPRDGVLAHLGIDLDDVIHPVLIRAAASYLDQGLAYWPMPDRERGFFGSVCQLLSQPLALHAEHLDGMPEEFGRQQRRKHTAEESVRESLQLLAVDELHWEAFIRAELLALPGWAGLFHTLEVSPDLAPHIVLPVSLMDFLAVRLVLLRVALHSATRGASDCWELPIAESGQQRLAAAAALFDVAHAVFLSAQELEKLPAEHRNRLVTEALAFDNLERRRVLHLAYERRHELQILLPLRTHRQSLGHLPVAPRPKAQVVFCLDEREESPRRHLEELAPDIETLGAAGFFGVAIDYKSLEDADSVSLCPVVVSPQHAVRETVLDGHHSAWERWTAFRKISGRMSRAGFLASRSLLRGWFATATLGVLSLFPLIARTLRPREYARLRERLNSMIIPRPETELAFTRDGHELLDGLQKGFAIAEKADRVAGVLGGAGLLGRLSRLVVILGHGATCVNNPHESAYNCGACGGHRGGPNARLFAAMANHAEVRAELARRGMPIPEDTHFVGGYHDTASDDIDLYHTSDIPSTHIAEFQELRQTLDQVRALNAQERSRRFALADSRGSAAKALQHVEERTEHLAEPRPEYGHCTNAVCIVGRRSITRGLFLDRRAFLVSYDATQDPEDRYLAAQLGAAVPVCGGINLEYYFSCVDNEIFGCGTKLPHNVAGLVGVMNGHQGDLRTGLAQQMIEIHEPVRALFVIETTPERLRKVIDGNAVVREFCLNQWVRVSTIDPDTGVVHVLRNGEFEVLKGESKEIPSATSSAEWYRGRSGHLPIARIIPVPSAVSATEVRQ